METLDIPQVIAEISQFFAVYGTLMKEVLLIFAVIVVSVFIKKEPVELPIQNDDEAPFS